jgi:hypothetical protein
MKVLELYGVSTRSTDEVMSTDTNGIARSLGLQVSPKVELEEILALLESKIAEDTLLVLR